MRNQRKKASFASRGNCPQCGASNRAAALTGLQIEMRPVLTAVVPVFPEALAEVVVLKCPGCGYRMCLDYSIELDDNPEIDLNEKVAS